MSVGTPVASRALVDAVRVGLRELADPVRAEQMRAYMKSEMPYLGVAMPIHRKLTKRLFRDHPLPSFEAWRDTTLALWREAEYREERYCATNLVNSPLYRQFQDRRDALPIYREMIVTGAWWDYVDPIADHRLGALLKRYPKGMATTMREWARGRDIWKRRAAIISQMALKELTDVDLLHDTIEPSLDESEFFLRKGIGWALREYAKTDPDAVIAYVTANRARLSPLSQREALRNVLDKEALGRFLAESARLRAEETRKR